MRQLLTSWPPSIVSAKCTSQLSSGSRLPIPAAMPPSAMTVWALPSSDLVTTVTLQPASAAIAARMPAPPAPTTSTSHSMVSYASGDAVTSEDDVRIDEDPGTQQVDVHVGDDNAEHAAPCPDGVALVEHGHPLPGAVAGLAELRLRVAVEPAADEMAPRVAAECVAAEQDDVDQHDPGAEPELHVAVGCEEGEVDVIPEEAGDDQHEVEEEPVEVVEEERERGLAAVFAVAELTDRARRGVPEERAVVRLAVVVAGGPEQQRRPEHPEGGTDRAGLPDGRRVERREIRPALIDPAGQECRPDRIEAEETEHGDNRRRQDPPGKGIEDALDEPGTAERRGSERCGRYLGDLDGQARPILTSRPANATSGHRPGSPG